MPCKVTILKSEIRPETCGATQFLNTVGAYAGLSSDQQAYYRSLRAKYCYLKTRVVTDAYDSNNLSAEEAEKANKCAVHPVITQHPVTGAYNIYANPSHTSAILFPTDTDVDTTDRGHLISDAVLQELFQYTNQSDKFGYTHEWRDYDVLMWDNRAVHHRATGCPDDAPRLLVRTTVNNDEAPRGSMSIESVRYDEL
jgi:alpha-ketoglutarate-dependent taurine dioxygenase